MNVDFFQKLAADRPATLKEVDVNAEPITEKNVNDVQRLTKGAMKIGVLRLRAGYENSLEWFTWSAKHKMAVIRYGFEQNPPWDSPFDLFEALSTAVLSNDKELVVDAVAVAREMDTVSEDSPMYTAMRTVVDCLVALLSDDGRFEQAVDELRTVVNQYKDTDGFQALDADTTRRYVSYARFMEGIRDSDREAVTDAIELMVEYHDEELFDDPEEDHTSIDATILTILARREGFDVEVESEYIPETLPV